MRKGLIKVAALVLLAVLFATPLSLVSCGEEETGETKITFGFLYDLTGRASFGVKQMYNGLQDYLRMTEEKDPIPGAKIEIITYDTQSDSGRVPVGYMWLKGKGAVMMSASPPDTILLRHRLEADNIPFLGGANMFPLLDCDLYACLYGPAESQVEILLRWIMDTWDYGLRKPKVGAVSLAGVLFYEGQVDMVESMCKDFPDKFDWMGAQMAPATTTSWAVEVGRLLDCDFIVVCLSGPPLASFTKEARNRGYNNRLIGGSDSFISFWDLVKGSVAPEGLDGIVTSLLIPWWDEDVAFIRELKEYTQKYHTPAEVEAAYLSTGHISGWGYGMLLVDTVRRAVEEVGAANVDGPTLCKALHETDLAVEGFGNRLRLTEEVNHFSQVARVLEYRATEDKWVPISDWYQPVRLGD